MEELRVVSCPTCQRPVTDADAAFCPRCGTRLGPPRTLDLDETAPVVPDTPTIAAAPAAAEAAAVQPVVAVVAPAKPIDNRKAAYVGFVGAALAIIGAFQKWISIRIAGFIPPGSSETGWRGGDGRTIVVAAAVAAIAAGALFLGRRELWLKIVLLIAGGVTIVIALVHMVDAGSKASDIEMQFGIPAGDVQAQIGAGLYLVVVGGVGLLAAGLQARTSS